MTPAPATFVLAAPIDTTAQWADLDLPAMASALQSTGVYAPADQVPALEKVVAGAAADGHDLQIVVLEKSYSPFTVYRDIATELQSQVGGTVLVIGPSGMGTASDEFSRVELEDGTGEVKAGTSPAVAAQQIYDRATEPHVDWTVLTILLIVLVALCAVGARIAMVRRRG